MAELKEAMYTERVDDKVRCLLCPNECVMKQGDRGVCRSRMNIGGKVYSLIYGRCASEHLDPIEKKPLYHFYPGSNILSFGTLGCNFSCIFCQNWSISQVPAEEMTPGRIDRICENTTPQDAVCLALDLVSRGNIGIAYTYNEPSIWYEFVLDTAKLAREKGLRNVLVTNGYLSEAPLQELLPYIDAANVDLKSSNPEFYKKYCRGKLESVLDYLRVASKNTLLEITNLVIPTLNDSEEDLHRLVDWIAQELGPDTPLHFSRYHPDYKMNLPATPVSTLERAREIAARKLNYIYVGNVWNSRWDHTYCPGCGRVVIERMGFSISGYHLDNENRCKHCGREIRIVNR